MPTVHVEEVDGVPLLWVDGPAPVEAALVFGTGAADETFTTVGVGHLVEHLVMNALPRRPSHDVNAMVLLHTTRFWSSGPAEAVGRSLLQIAESIARPDASGRAHETSVLRAEGGTPVPPPVLEAVVTRYGYHGPALAAVRTRLEQLSDDMVLDHWRTHLVRGNAVLTLTAPPESCGIDLAAVVAALPEGPAPAHDVPTEVAFRGPVTTPALSPAVTCSFAGNAADDATIQSAAEILAWRLEDALRHDAGLAYDVDMLTARPRDGRVVAALSIEREEDATPAALDRERAVAGRTRTVVEEFLRDGPTTEELAQSREHLEAAAGDPRAWPEIVASSAAELFLTGRVRQPAEIVAELAASTTDSVRAVLQALRPALVLHLPSEPAGPEWPLLDPWAGGEPVAGRRFGRKLVSLAPRWYSAVVGDEGVSIRDEEGWLTARWADVVGLGRADGVRSIVARQGPSLDVHLGGLSGGRDFGRLVDEHVDPRLWFDLTDEDL